MKSYLCLCGKTLTRNFVRRGQLAPYQATRRGVSLKSGFASGGGARRAGCAGHGD